MPFSKTKLYAVDQRIRRKSKKEQQYIATTTLWLWKELIRNIITVYAPWLFDDVLHFIWTLDLQKFESSITNNNWICLDKNIYTWPNYHTWFHIMGHCTGINSRFWFFLQTLENEELYSY